MPCMCDMCFIADAINFSQQLQYSKRDGEVLDAMRVRLDQKIRYGNNGKQQSTHSQVMRKRLAQLQARINNAQQSNNKMQDQIAEFLDHTAQQLMTQISSTQYMIKSDCEEIKGKVSEASIGQQHEVRQSKLNGVERRKIKKVEQQVIAQRKKMREVWGTIAKNAQQQVQLAIHAGLLEDQISNVLLEQYGQQFQQYQNLTIDQISQTNDKIQFLSSRYQKQKNSCHNGIEEVKQRMVQLRRDFRKLASTIHGLQHNAVSAGRVSQVNSNGDFNRVPRIYNAQGSTGEGVSSTQSRKSSTFFSLPKDGRTSTPQQTSNSSTPRALQNTHSRTSHRRTLSYQEPKNSSFSLRQSPRQHSGQLVISGKSLVQRSSSMQSLLTPPWFENVQT
eukprot:TRINITY_DN19440_c0_g1_i2.p1 TRINITY_DN19440_c0_g1~~TRINITY_DN19440_c0_g1_i2.p1  ORF type:complete len:389 (-),score=16.56 TRINITY_DN19440_c0_g1_i2:293-1459(-)